MQLKILYERSHCNTFRLLWCIWSIAVHYWFYPDSLWDSLVLWNNDFTFELSLKPKGISLSKARDKSKGTNVTPFPQNKAAFYTQASLKPFKVALAELKKSLSLFPPFCFFPEAFGWLLAHLTQPSAKLSSGLSQQSVEKIMRVTY